MNKILGRTGLGRNPAPPLPEQDRSVSKICRSQGLRVLTPGKAVEMCMGPCTIKTSQRDPQRIPGASWDKRDFTDVSELRTSWGEDPGFYAWNPGVNRGP